MHASLWSSLQVRPPVGACRLPVKVRFVEDGKSAMVLRVEGATELKVGDVMTRLDGVPVGRLVEE